MKTKKHHHADILIAMANDSDLVVEYVGYMCARTKIMIDKPEMVGIKQVADDTNGSFIFRIKPKEDEYQVFRDALKDGQRLDYFLDSDWHLYPSRLHRPSFRLPAACYRIHDKYRHLKEARDAGKTIAYRPSADYPYIVMNNLNFKDPVDCYKIAEDDKEYEVGVTVFGEWIRVKLKKSGITGEITAEVVK